jgi:hypothetical protein
MKRVGRPSRRTFAGGAGWFALMPTLLDARRHKVADAPNATDVTGRLEGMVTLACRSSAGNCRERPYRVGLWLEDPRTGRQIEAIPVSPVGKFAVRVLPGAYRIISADVRGACCLPILRPLAVTIAPGRVTRVNVRFEPGLQLPTR